MAREGRACLWIAAAALVAGCGRSGAIEPGETAPHVPGPRGAFPSPTAVVAPAPLPFGDGSDGLYSVTTGTHRPTPCWVLVGTTGSGLALAPGQGTSGVSLVDGDVLLLHQTQGHVATSGDATPIATTGTAGQWQLVLVLDSAAGMVTVSPTLDFAFRSSGDLRAQACRVPQYTVATVVDATLEAHPWDGATGGIVAMLVDDTLSLAGTATITADGLGFRGGPAANGGGGFLDQLDTPAASVGRKGEGIDRRSYLLHGKGNYANAGGGGNFSDGGGGGGGGAGTGGTGGRTFQSADATRCAIGGAPIAVIAERIHFGGGGGSGQDNGGGGPPPGGAGGGIVLLAPRILVGAATVRVSAAGKAGTGTGNNGGGGGGGGGTVHLHAETSNFAGGVDVRGGSGGSCSNDHGPGGGGGGGSIRADVALAGTLLATGGANGITVNTDPRSATPGGAGDLD